MKVSLVVAMARNGVIGRDGKLPWHLPDDLKRFKATTVGRAVIMGRKTFESIGKALPNRQNIVITRRGELATATAQGCDVVASLEEALARVLVRDECFVIGGGEIYRAALPRADRILLTQVDADVEGDVRFPPFDAKEWTEVACESHPADERHAYAFAIVTLQRTTG